MQMNINQSDIDKIEHGLQLQAIRSSKVPDSKDIFKSKEREKAIKKRYGKDVLITITYELDGKKIKELTQRYQSPKNRVYAITEYFTDAQTTDHCILSCRRNGKNYEYKFDRFLDAEISLIDMIAEE